MSKESADANADALTDEAYWDQFWEISGVSIKPSRGQRRDHVRELLVDELRAVVTPDSRWLEIGCVSSTFLLDFPQVLQARLEGIDISVQALAATRRALQEQGIQTAMSCHDVLEPRPEEIGAYDGVFSYGFIEHFGDLVGMHRAVARYLRPGGRIFTIVPNMAGINGMLQLAFDSEIFLTHHVVTPPLLRDAMTEAGFVVNRCDSLMGINLGAVNVGERRHRPVGRALEAGLVGASRLVWEAERILGRAARPKLWRAPYILAIGTLDET